MRLLVTGSRYFSDEKTVAQVLSDYHTDDAVVLVHGGARGLDSLASNFASEHGWAEEVHYADWSRYGRAAGVIRNKEMVSQGADVCVGFPLPGSKGTWDCVARAKRAGIPVRVVE